MPFSETVGFECRAANWDLRGLGVYCVGCHTIDRPRGDPADGIYPTDIWVIAHRFSGRPVGHAVRPFVACG